MLSKCSEKHAYYITLYLNRYLTEPIRDPMQLFKQIESVEKGKRYFCMAIRDLLNFYEAFSLMDEVSLHRYRKVVRIPPTSVDDYIPETEKVVSAFKEIEDKRYRLFFKLLAGKGHYIAYQKGSIHRLLLFVKLGSLHRVPF